LAKLDLEPLSLRFAALHRTKWPQTAKVDLSGPDPNYPQRFTKIASLCPGVYAISPFASFSAMKAILERTGGDPQIGFGIWLLAKNYVADEREWRRISPLNLVKQADEKYPALYISNGLYDANGNFEGSQMLANEAARRGVSVDWHPLYGGHCAIDVPSLARFLAT
jgi:hypothetical protein